MDIVNVDALVTELRELEQKKATLDDQMDNGTFWYKEEVFRLHNAWQKCRDRIKEINKILDS